MRRPGHLVRPGASTTCPAPLPRPTRGRGGWLAADERALAKLRIDQPTPDGAELRRHERPSPCPRTCAARCSQRLHATVVGQRPDDQLLTYDGSVSNPSSLAWY